MRRLTLAALAVAAAAPAAAQRVAPETLPARELRDGGVLDWATGTWSRGAGPGPIPGGIVVYDNTCTWSGGASFAPLQDCWQVYDDGRIPNDPGLPGSGPCNRFCGFEIAYCTSEPTGGVNVQVAFYEGIESSGTGGICTGFPIHGQPASGNGKPLPPNNLFGPRDLFVDLTGAGLPGDPGGGGTQTCWIVTIDFSNEPGGGFPFYSDGDGFTDDDPYEDSFNWAWQQRGTTATFGPTGPVVAWDAGVAPPGAGTYGKPPGNDPNFTGPCGSGLDNDDSFWMNVDDTGVGSPLGGACPNPGLGTGCYSFGGFPTNPHGGFFMRMYSRNPEPGTVCQAASGPENVSIYCTAKVTSNGCVPSIGFQGTPSAGLGFFEINCYQVINNKTGLMFYGLQGPANIPWSPGGILCVAPPLKRTAISNSFGNPPPDDCSGFLSFDFFDWFASGVDPALQVGTDVNCQWWFRDPLAPMPMGTGMSNAAQFRWSP